MPAKSENQQQLMAMALLYKRGKMKTASAAVKKLANNMSEKELEKYAKTATHGLPKRIKKEDVKNVLEKVILKVDGDFRIRSANTGKLWPQKYKTYKNALDALKAYQVQKNETLGDAKNQIIDQLKTVVNTKSSGKVGEDVLDVPSAAIILSVYDSLDSIDAKNKFLDLPLEKMKYVSEKLINLTK